MIYKYIFLIIVVAGGVAAVIYGGLDWADFINFLKGILALL